MKVGVVLRILGNRLSLVLLKPGEERIQRRLHVLLPGQPAAQLQPQPGPPMVRPDRLEADRDQEVGGDHAAGLGDRRRRVIDPAERLDGLHPRLA